MATATIDVLTAVANVEQAVEKVINDADQNFPEAATVGDAVRQGDIYIQRIDDFAATPMFYTKVNKPNFPLQLAPGNTKGSRHMLEESAGLEVWVSNAARFMSDESFSVDDWDVRNKAVRDFIASVEKYAKKITKEKDEEAKKWQSQSRVIGTEITETLNFCGPIFVAKNKTTVSHPEHGNWILPPGTYRVVFQRTMDSNMRIQRVFD